MPTIGEYGHHPNRGFTDQDGVYHPSAADNLVAKAGGGQAGATPVFREVNRVTVVATANDSLVLPQSNVPQNITVINAAANSANVFPQPGDSINALGINAAYALAGTKVGNFYTITAGQWHAGLLS